MSSEIVVAVEGISKLYYLNRPKTGRSLRQVAEDMVFAVPRWLKKKFSGAEKTESEQPSIWALKDIHLTLRRGEILGIVGRNGSGKSTLLKILSRLTRPTTGRALVRGRVASLLEVGVGFHYELSGRENIYLNGAIMGMSTEEIESKFDSIVQFAEVEKFIDSPVKHYSSGMYMRLAFAVAVHLDPQILILDEVLAVGDISFQKRCLEKIQEIRERGTTILMVSHSMQPILDLCSQAICLQNGEMVASGAARDVVQHYLEINPDARLENQKPIDRLPANSFEVSTTEQEAEQVEFSLRSASLDQSVCTAEGAVPQHLDFESHFTLTSKSNFKAHIQLFDENERLMLSSRPAELEPLENDPQSLTVKVPGGWLEPGRYQLELVVELASQTVRQRCFQFQIVHTRLEGLGARVQRPALAWSLKNSVSG